MSTAVRIALVIIQMVALLIAVGALVAARRYAHRARLTLAAVKAERTRLMGHLSGVRCERRIESLRPAHVGCALYRDHPGQCLVRPSDVISVGYLYPEF